MTVHSRKGVNIAVLDKTDKLGSAQGVMDLLEQTFSNDCRGLIIPKELIAGALSLLKSDLQAQIAARFGDKSPKVAIVGSLGGLLENIINGFLKKNNLEGGLSFYKDMETALEAMSA